jgi:methionine-rich copper-binding protein CopC
MKKTIGLLLVLAVVIGAFGAAVASAHVSVVARSPGKGKTVPRSTHSVKIRFNETIRSGTLKVYRVSSGRKVSNGTGNRDPRNLKRIVTTLKSGLASGQYIAKWTCKAADGHVQSGSWKFRLG